MSSGAVHSSIIYQILHHHLSEQGGLDYVAYAHTHGLLVMGEPIEVSRHRITDALKKLALAKREENDRGHPGRTREDQVRLWRALIPQIHRALCALDEIFLPVGQGENVRVIFDIDMGGFFYTRVGGHGFVFGAALDQAEVNSRKCEDEMRNMVAEIEAVCTSYGA